MKYLIFALLLISPWAYADAGSAVAIVAGAAGVGLTSYRGQMMSELQDWKNPATDSTVQMTHQCGVSSEWRLFGDNAYNVLVFVVNNDSDQTVFADVAHLHFRFDTGKDRLAVFQKVPAPVRIEAHDQITFTPFFPSKADFKDAKHISFDLPVKDRSKTCHIQVTIDRPPQVQRAELTSTSVTSIELGLSGGGSVARSGHLRSLGRFKTFGGLFFKGYPGLHNGIYLDMQFQSILVDKNRAAEYGLTLDDAAQSLGIFILGYSYRNWFRQSNSSYSGDLSYSVDVGLGDSQFSYQSKGEKKNSSILTAQLKVNFGYLLKRVPYGIWRGDYTLGASIGDIWMPGASMGGVPASGDNLIAEIFFKIGE